MVQGKDQSVTILKDAQKQCKTVSQRDRLLLEISGLMIEGHKIKPDKDGWRIQIQPIKYKRQTQTAKVRTMKQLNVMKT